MRLNYWPITRSSCFVSVPQNYGFLFFFCHSTNTFTSSPDSEPFTIFSNEKFTKSPDMLKSKYPMCYMNTYKCQQLPAVV